MVTALLLTLPAGAESRDYHVSVDVKPGAASRRCLPPGQPDRQAGIRGADPGLGARPGDLDRRRSAVHADQPPCRRLRSSAAARPGHAERLEAHKAGDDDTAAAELGPGGRTRARTPATRTQPRWSTWLNAATGTVHLKARSPTRTRWHLTPDRARPSGSGSGRQGKNRVYTGSAATSDHARTVCSEPLSRA